MVNGKELVGREKVECKAGLNACFDMDVVVVASNTRAKVALKGCTSDRSECKNACKFATSGFELNAKINVRY